MMSTHLKRVKTSHPWVFVNVDATFFLVPWLPLLMQLQTTACASAESAYILRSTLHISRLSSQAIWRPWQASIPAQQEPSCAHYSPEISASWYSQEKKSTNVVFYLHQMKCKWSWYESGAGFNAAGCVQRPTLLSSETCVKLSTFKTLAGYPFSDILD